MQVAAILATMILFTMLFDSLVAVLRRFPPIDLIICFQTLACLGPSLSKAGLISIQRVAHT